MQKCGKVIEVEDDLLEDLESKIRKNIHSGLRNTRYSLPAFVQSVLMVIFKPIHFSLIESSICQHIAFESRINIEQLQAVSGKTVIRPFYLLLSGRIFRSE